MKSKGKIIVIGCPGAGKTTFSRKLAETTGIELFYLDSIWWRKSGGHISRGEFVKKQGEILKKESYIIDGNFRRTLEMRIKAADRIFLFDIPTEDCIEGVKIRQGCRSEMPCELPVDDGLIEDIKGFNKRVLPEIFRLLEKHGKTPVIFHSRAEADEYIEALRHPDLTLELPGNGYFNLRAAAVIIKDGRVLVQSGGEDKMRYLPGGRVRFGESSKEALQRELCEELGIKAAEMRELWVNECFFTENYGERRGADFHEIGIYYYVPLEGTGFNEFAASFEREEAGRKNHYEWLKIGELDGAELYPLFIKNEIRKIGVAPKLIITKEREF